MRVWIVLIVSLIAIGSLMLRREFGRIGREEERVTVFFEKNSSFKITGFTVIHEFETISAVTISVTKKELETIKNMDGVERIIIDRKATMFRASSMPVIRLNDAYSLGYNGSGVNISIIDTGVFNHSEFISPNRLLSNQKCYCCSNPAVGCGDGNAGCCPDNTAIDDDATDDESHGTHVAGIAGGELGVANGSSILAVKVLDSSGSGYDSDVAKGIEWAFLNGADVISLSLGGCIDSSDSDCYADCYDSLSSKMVENAFRNNTVVVAAVGNSGSNSQTIAWPACAKNAISVGSTTDNDVIVGSSSRGPTDNGNRTKPDLTGPGSSISSTINSLNGYGTKSGTSMANPHVAGVSSLVIQKYNETFGYFPEPGRVKAILLSSTNTTGMQTAGYEQRNNDYGSGRIDAYEALRIINYTKNSTISQGQTDKYILNVSDDTKVTLYWPEDEDTNNDLNLIVGNDTQNFSYLTSVNDNAEQVFLYNVTSGFWKVYVKSISGNQEYFLASNMELFDDVTPPFIGLISPGNDTYANKTIQLNFTSDNTNQTIWYTIDGENETAVTSNTTLNVSSDGSYNITLYANDSYDNTNKTTVWFSVDTVKPIVEIISPTLNQSFNSSPVWFNISLNENGNISLFSIDDGDNTTMTGLNQTYFYNLSVVTEGNHNVTFYVNDTAGWENSSTVNFSVMVKPLLFNPTKDKPLIAQNETINVSVNIVDENIDSVWINVTIQDSSSVKTMTNVSTFFSTTFNQTSQTGVYNVTVFANDTYGNMNNTNLSFQVSQQIRITINVTNGITARNISFKILYTIGKTRVQTTNQTVNETIPVGIWDVESNTSIVNITMRSVNFTEAIPREMNVNDSIQPNIGEYVSNIRAVAVELTNFSFVDANLSFTFNESLVTNRNKLKVYRCEKWNFSSSSCNSTWYEDSSDLTFNATIHQNNVSLITSGFSGYSLSETELYCGDGECSGTESCSTCSADCGSCTTTTQSSGGGGGGIVLDSTTTTIILTSTMTVTSNTTTTIPQECDNGTCEQEEECQCLSGQECVNGVCMIPIKSEVQKRNWYMYIVLGFLVLIIVFLLIIDR